MTTEQIVKIFEDNSCMVSAEQSLDGSIMFVEIIGIDWMSPMTLSIMKRRSFDDPMINFCTETDKASGWNAEMTKALISIVTSFNKVWQDLYIGTVK